MSVTAPAGFLAAGGTAGLKPSGRSDLALVVNTGPQFHAAGVFTTNRVQAAPVLWSRQVLGDGRLQAVILNSGGANACTGRAGFGDTHRTAELVAAALQASGRDVGPIDVAVCSTGLIGVRLPMDRIGAGIEQLVPALSRDGGKAAAEAIMTTDTVPKQAVYEGDGWRIGGMAKGAAMLAPGLATMLVLITTDAVLDPGGSGGASPLTGRVPGDIHDHLADACQLSFERVDSDGCMSTNDTVLLLSSGASGVAPSADDFTHGLTTVCLELALAMIADAEGANHDVAITVRNAASEEDAVQVGRSIARSNLLKCAIFGRDPNWGRVLAAIGTTSATFEPDELDVEFNGVQVCRAGAIGDSRDLVDLGGRAVQVGVDLHAGPASATIWTNDLTYGYVELNAEYST